ncbi:MAG: transcription termination/antitermination NusG family protein [Planctomycetota bacterium]|jgi:transcription antitermination factor NusG
MPLVPAETSLFPERLLEPSETVADASARWWVLHTRPRAEKSLARRLLGREVGFYLPLYENRLVYGDRVRSSYLPLFPGYVFLHGNDEDRRLALETNQIAQSLPVSDQAELWSDLRRIHQLIETRQNLTPEQRLQPGTPVRIIAGAFAGMTGEVIRQGRQLRFLIAVKFLQCGASVDVESWMIEPLEAPFRLSDAN